MGCIEAVNVSNKLIGMTQTSNPVATNELVDIKQLRNAVPAHLFKPLWQWAVWYIVRDAVLVGASMALAAFYIPQIKHDFLRFALWTCYGYIEGLFMTGIWVLGHEAGHGALSPSETLNNIVGFIFHSFLLTPYFSWRFTHRRHHMHANNLARDHNFVPPLREGYSTSFTKLDKVNEMLEDAPFFVLLRLVLQQTIGFPCYLLTNIASSPGSTVRPSSRGLFTESHFLPWSPLFRLSESHLIFLSDIGVLVVSLGLWYAITRSSLSFIAVIYFQPWIWVNHWLVAITYLHHTHPDVPKYEHEAWTFVKGATATIDRNFGWIGRHIFHNITDYHVVHHIFPLMIVSSRIPFYYGEQATHAIRDLLGSHYHEDRKTHWGVGLWQSFTECKWVEPDNENADPAHRTMWYKAGPACSIIGQQVTAQASGQRHGWRRDMRL